MAKDLTGNKYLRGMDQNTIRFGSQAEMVEVMQSKDYAQSQDCRDVVQRMIANGDAAERIESAQSALDKKGVPAGRQLEYAMADREGARRLEDEAIFKEQSLKLFADPRYEKSPTYRREVENWLRENTPAIDAAMPKGSLVDRNIGHGAVRVTFGEGSAEASRFSRDQAQAEKDKAALKEKHDRVDRGESSEIIDLGGIRH